MASTIKLLALTLFLGLVLQVKGDCILRDLGIAQSKTGMWAHGMPEVNVTITNQCVCAQSQVKLDCHGFQTNYSPDPSILRVSGDECLLKNGQPIAQHETVNFLYAWDPLFPFHPISAQSDC